MDNTGAPIRILMIDDNEPDAYLVAEALRIAQIKCELTHIKDGNAIVKSLAGEAGNSLPPADLVLLDLNLPRVDGCELLAAMRKHPSFAKTPVAIMSSSLSEQDRARCVALGANHCLIKPLELNDFVDAIVGTVRKMLSI